MIGVRAFAVFAVFVFAVFAPGRVFADDRAGFDRIARDYVADARPLLKQFCLRCHSGELQEGELDLEQFATFEQARRSPGVWLKVVEMLDNGEMPPKKKKPQPSVEERKRLRDWSRRFLDAEARANAGDPGPVLLRRLSNVEYDNTIRDLTQIDLRPAREFPVDGAAGEGFTNVGEALVMSPAMFDKYVAAAKTIAGRAVLLPDGFRFSEKATRRDWTDELVGQIRRLYRRHTDPEGATRVNLQGLTWTTNAGGRIPLEAYLSATLKLRDAFAAGDKSKTLAALAADTHLSEKYLRILWDLLNLNDNDNDAREPSPIIDRLRELWRGAKPADVPTLAAEIRGWQAALTRFNSVAHFKRWLDPIDPIAESRAIRLKLPADPNQDVVIRLVARDRVAGLDKDFVEWRAPRFEAVGRPTIFLRDLRDGLRGLDAKRRTFADVVPYLAAVDEGRERESAIDIDALAKKHGLDPSMLSAWLDFLGVVGGSAAKIDSPFVEKMETGGGFPFVKGWGSPATPSVVANSADREVRIPGTLKPHSIAAHPSPTQNVGVGWSSPIASRVRVEAVVAHAHPDCGNGVSWSLELRRGGGRRRLASGELELGKTAKIAPIDDLSIQTGDLITLTIGPRAKNHSCDLTRVDLTIAELAGARRIWNLAKDVSPDILAGNPHADTLGNPRTWHFFQEKSTGETIVASTIPRGSSLDLWRDEPRRDEREKIAERLRRLLVEGPASTIKKDDPDAVLYRAIVSANGPLLGKLDFARLALEAGAGQTPNEFGLARESFGKPPRTGERASDSGLFVQAPSVTEIRLPGDLAIGREFVVDSFLDTRGVGAGSVQADATINQKPLDENLVPGVPILVRNNGEARAQVLKSFAEFRRVFPAALCYEQIVPVDEVVTLVLFHRDDEALERLMLDDSERRTLDRLWDELRYVGQDALTVKVVYAQFMEFVTQDGDVRVFEPLRKPIAARAEELRKRLIDTEPKHLDALVAFAAKAYRRPLTLKEETDLRALYANLRKRDLDHDAAFRLTLTRVLIAPSFLYRAETSSDGAEAKPVSDWELASRLSYFLWSSAPDDELRRLAESGKLRDPDVLEAQAKRMLNDPRVRALATEFACQWLDIRGFDEHDEKSEQVFPQFAALRGAMYEEAVRFFIDFFRNDRRLFDVLDCDRAFLNEALAQFYEIPGVIGPDWRRVDGVKARGRGGVLGMAALLAKQSGASRTSPVLRGNWLLETLLGEKLPKPPKNVPVLPESELDTDGLTMRQLTEKHRNIESCMKCHEKIDPFGFALEGFDAIGRRRAVDLAGRPIDARARLKDGTEFADIEGLRQYLLTKRREEFVNNFCRKLLGYSLGRSTRLSDGPLLEEIRRGLTDHDDRVQTAVTTIVRSPQFRLRRGLKSKLEQVPDPVDP